MVCKICGDSLENNRHNKSFWCIECGNKNAVRRQLTYVARLKERARDKLGRQCAICGSTENLEIDHVHGNGSIDRKAGRLTGGWLYRQVIKDTEGNFQMLCRTCNAGKGQKTTQEYIDYILQAADRIRSKIG